MKNNMYMSLLMALVSISSLTFVSCGSDSDDPEAPVIVMKEANIEDNELCVEANVVAKGRTASVLIEVYDSTERNVKVNKAVTDAKYINVLNIDDFHVHVDITGKNVVVNDVLKLTVADANGHSTTAKRSVTKEEHEDHEHLHE